MTLPIAVLGVSLPDARRAARNAVGPIVYWSPKAYARIGQPIRDYAMTDAFEHQLIHGTDSGRRSAARLVRLAELFLPKTDPKGA